MVSGRQTLGKIETTLADLRNDEAGLNRRLAGVTDAVGRHRADAAEALRDLARFKLAEDGASIANRLDAASRDVVAAMTARDKTIAALNDERRTKAEALAKVEKRLADARAELDAVEDRIEALVGPLKAALAKDKAHVALAEAAENAAATAAAAEAKAGQAATDRGEKGAAYERDPLFIYLWRRHYGAADYRSRGLVRALDGWVAGLVGYAAARANYALLTEIPVRLRRHAERLAEEARAADAAMAASEDAALAKLAGEDLAAEADALTDEIAEREAEIAPLRDELAQLDQRTAVFAAGDDEDYQKAIAALSRSLAGDDIATLTADAEATPSPEDERFVARLHHARTAVDDAERETKAMRAQLAKVSRRRTELTDVARDFRRRGWDSGGSRFDAGDVVGGLLTAFVLGKITRGDYWGRIEKAHRSAPSRSRGGFGLPGGFRTASRIATGAFKTAGKFGGRGFRTGRKF